MPAFGPLSVGEVPEAELGAGAGGGPDAAGAVRRGDRGDVRADRSPQATGGHDALATGGAGTPGGRGRAGRGGGREGRRKEGPVGGRRCPREAGGLRVRADDTGGPPGVAREQCRSDTVVAKRQSPRLAWLGVAV